MDKRYVLGIIGGGFMARAIAEGAIGSGFLSPENIIVGEPDRKQAEYFLSRGIAVCIENKTVAECCGYLLFAVKPQAFAEAARGLSGTDLPVIITIMAGVTKERIKRELTSPQLKIARVMPNLPCSVGKGMTGVDALDLERKDREFVMGLFSSFGKTIGVREEQLNAVTGISGSGPAYVFLFLQALMKAGEEQGFTQEEAKTLALQTVAGGVALAESQREKSFQELIAAVSSKGGTTLAALACLQAGGFEETVSRAVDAAVHRAEELSR